MTEVQVLWIIVGELLGLAILIGYFGANRGD